MAGFDELIEHLLYEIALSGSQGLSAQQFERAVRNYYNDKNSETGPNDFQSDDDLLFSRTPPVKRTIVDSHLLETALQWLHEHPDVDINDEDNSQTLDAASANVPVPLDPTSLESKLAGKRISTSEDRVWQAIAGHGIDHKRIPQLEFDILSVIAAHGPAGVLQPHVRKLTGQDKRSVPKRTDMLAAKGYIIKENVVGAGAKTSNLKLKRYAGYQPLQSTEKQATIYYDVWFDKTMQLLKENDNIVAVNDLRLDLGVSKKYDQKILKRCMRRLVETGCIRCISAKLQDADGNPVTHPASGKEQKVQSIQLLREPTKYDRIKWAQSDTEASRPSQDISDDEDDQETSHEDNSYADAAVPGDEGELVDIENSQDDLDLLRERIPPQWTPDIPIVNLVYNLVDEAGPEGISSMDLANRLTGPVWRRPLDQVMLLLTDVWQHSQPPHLQHLAVVRDTGIHGKMAHYQFKTYDNFQKAVEAGNATWEAVMESAKAKGKKKATDSKAALDEWGFPVVPLKELAGRDGRATSSQGRRRAAQIESASDDENVGLEGDIDAMGDQQPEDDVATEGNVDMEVFMPQIDSTAKPELLSTPLVQTARVKRKRRYEHREDAFRPGVPLVKKKEIPQHEYDEWEASVDMLATRKVMTEMNANRTNDNDSILEPISAEDLPAERLAQVKEDLKAREKSGIYINPPGARSMKRENYVSRGRPRKALIAVIKTKSLNDLDWFRDDDMPRFAPMPSKRKTAKAGVKAADAKISEPVEPDSEQDEPPPKKQRLNTSRPKNQVNFGDDPHATPSQASDIPPRASTAQPPATAAQEDVPMSFGVTSTSGALLPREQEQELRNGVESTAHTSTPVEVPPADQNAASKKKAGRIEYRQLSSDAMNQTQPTEKGAIVPTAQTEQASDDVTDSLKASQFPATDSLTAFTQPNAVEQLKTLKSRRGRRSKETLERIAELEKQIEEGVSQTVADEERLKALKSKPGRRPKSTVAEIVELEHRLELGGRKKTTAKKPAAEVPAVAQDGTTTTTEANVATNTISASGSSSGTASQPLHRSLAMPPPTGNRKFPASNRRHIEVFTKDYVLAHPDEVFHHRGQGRYGRGPRPPKAAPNVQPSLNLASESAVPAEASKEIARRSDANASKVRNSTLPEEESTGENEQLAKSQPVVANGATLFDTALTEETSAGRLGEGQTASDAAEDSEQPATHLSKSVDTQEARPTESEQVSTGQQDTPTDQFSAEYVEQHPEETFYHRGRGKWARGLPPPGSTARVAVRGPGAEAWKSSMGMPIKPAKPSLRQSQTPSTANPIRRSDRPTKPRNPDGTVNKVARAVLVVKLRLPRPYLAALASGTNDLSNSLNLPLPASAVLPHPQATLTTPSDRSNGLDVTDGQTPLNTVNNKQHQDSTPIPGPSTFSTLHIVRPYNVPVHQYSTPSRPDPTTTAELTTSSAVSTGQNEEPTVADDANEAEGTQPGMDIEINREENRDDDFAPPVDDSMDIDEPMVDPEAFEVGLAVPVEIENASPRQFKKTGTTRVGGNILAQRQKIILDAVRACDGVFPGNLEMWYVCVSAWKRMYNKTPDRHTVDNTIKNLQQSKKLKRFQFQFLGKKGQAVQRGILTEPDVDQDSVMVKEMQKKIIEAYPYYYLPPEVEIEDDVRAKLRNPYSSRKESAGDPTAAAVQRQSAFVHDDSAIVRQTQRVSDIETERARQQGFPDALSYRLHLHEETKTKKAEYHAKYREKTARGTENHLDLTSVEDAVVRRLPQKLPNPSHQRKPLGSLRSNAPTVRKNRRPRDVEGGMTLEDEARFGLRAASLLYHPAQAFHVASGTYNTSPVVPIQHTPELRTLRNRAVVLDGTQQHRLVYHSSNVPHDLVDILSHARSLDRGDKEQEFLQEIDSVQAWEQQLADHLELGIGSGNVFINHTLNQPHVSYPGFGQNLQEKKIAAPSALVKLQVPNLATLGIPSGTSGAQSRPSSQSIRPLGAQTLITPELSKRNGKTKRKYRSRKNKNLSLDDGARESDSEYVPEAPAPERRPMRIRPDGKEIATRDRKSGAEFKDAERLVIAIALVTTVCGGVHPEHPNWNIVAHALGFRYDGIFYRRRWDKFKRYRAGEVDRLQNAIREAFLAAYARDELPSVDFQNLSNTDWPALVTWVEQAVMPKVGPSEDLNVPDLLQSKEAMKEQFEIQEQASLFRLSADEYFTNITDMGRKHFALKYTHAVPLAVADEHVPDDAIVLKSWIRAITVTKRFNYMADDAATKLRSSFSTAMLEKATTEMIESRVVSQEKKGRQWPGRNFMIHNDVLAQFRRWPAKPEEHQYLRMVASAWANINEHFKSNDKLNLIAEASDPEYLVLTNMISEGQIKALAMLPPRKDDFDAPFPKLSPWGYAGPSYETKKVNPASLKSPVVYVKTSAYRSHHGLKSDIPIPLQPGIRAGENGARIPFWVDIHGNLIEDVWDMVIRSLVNLLVFRPGTTASRMQEAHSQKFGDWEIELALDWMDKTGVAKRCGMGVEEDGIWKGGWSAAEGWYCAFAPDVATWQAPAGAEVGMA